MPGGPGLEAVGPIGHGRNAAGFSPSVDASTEGFAKTKPARCTRLET